MALNDIKFIKGQGGLGRTLPNDDHKSGIVFLRSYASGSSAPAVPFTYDKVTGITDAESKGITEAAYPEEHYQISEFFRIQPDSVLHVIFGAAEDADYDFEEITTLQNKADGELRQIAVMTYSAFAITNIPKIQAVTAALETLHKPVSVIYAADLTGMTLLNMPDIRSQNSPKVSVVIAMDGNADGKALFDAGKIVPSVGATLGAVSTAKVNENIAWVEQFKMSAEELDVPAFANGELFKDVPEATLNQLNERGYIFLRKHIGIAGSYFNDSHTADLITSDYAYIENVRTIDKAIRNVRTVLLPKLNSPVSLNADGTLTLETITDWTNRAENALEAMKKDGEISGYEVEIDPNQNIGATSKLVINITLVINGVARNVEVEIGYGVIN